MGLTSGAKVTAATIEAWCRANPKRAVQLGRDLVTLQGNPQAQVVSLTKQPELSYCEWARDNRGAAQTLFFRLLPFLAPYANS